MLTSTQEDILKELYNVYIGEAAGLLSEIIQKRILLSVPEVKLISPTSSDVKQAENLESLLNGTILSTSLKFENALSGSAEFIFPTEQIKYVTALCLGEDPELTAETSHFSDEDFDIIKEIGNIILNCIMGGMGTLLEKKLEYDVPEILLHEKGAFKKAFLNAQENKILLFYVNFSVEESEVIGLILIKFSMDSIGTLIEKVDELGREFDE